MTPENDVEQQAYLKEDDDYWATGPYIEGVLEHPDYRWWWYVDGEEVSKELTEFGFPEFSRKKLATLPRGTWFIVTYNPREETMTLEKGYKEPDNFSP